METDGVGEEGRAGWSAESRRPHLVEVFEDEIRQLY